jgi:hypothetical protein
MESRLAMLKQDSCEIKDKHQEVLAINQKRIFEFQPAYAAMDAVDAQGEFIVRL